MGGRLGSREGSFFRTGRRGGEKRSLFGSYKLSLSKSVSSQSEGTGVKPVLRRNKSQTCTVKIKIFLIELYLLERRHKNDKHFVAVSLSKVTFTSLKSRMSLSVYQKICLNRSLN